MGWDHLLQITKLEDIIEFVRNVMEDAIFESIPEDQRPNEEDYDKFRVNLSEDKLEIEYLREVDVHDENLEDEGLPDEEQQEQNGQDSQDEQQEQNGDIVIKTIPLDPEHYWAIHQELLNHITTSLDSVSIPRDAYDCIEGEYAINRKIDEILSDGEKLSNYHSNVGSYERTMFHFFEDTYYDDTVYEIYEYMTKKSLPGYDPWKPTFLKLFPDCDFFVKCLSDYADQVETDEWDFVP